MTPEKFAQVDLRLRKKLLKSKVKLHFPRATLVPCKFTVGKAICVGKNLTPYFCTSCFHGKEPEKCIDSFLDRTNTTFSLPVKCKKCEVSPICLCACKLLNPETNACISYKFILKDLLCEYLDNPDLWIV